MINSPFNIWVKWQINIKSQGCCFQGLVICTQLLQTAGRKENVFIIQQRFLLPWNVFVDMLAVPKLRIARWDLCSSLICLKIHKVILNWTPRDQPEKHTNLFIRIKLDVIQWELSPTTTRFIVLIVKTAVNSGGKAEEQKRDGPLLQRWYKCCYG